MAVTPEHSKSQINKAGRKLAHLRRDLYDGKYTLDDVAQTEIDRYVAAFRICDLFRQRHAYPLRMTNANLRHYVRNYGDRVNVTQRLKKAPTIFDKLRRHPNMQLANMEDIAGVRAVLPDQAAVDAVTRKLRKNWTIHRYRDYVREPKESGYRAVHLIAIKQSVFVEVQLRTELQDAWANQVEHDSRALRVDYKSGLGEQAVHDYYVLVSELLAMRERVEEPTHTFMDELISRYKLAKPYLASAQDQ